MPVVLDTDIGTDIDDAYALAFLVASPELELRGVTTVNHDTRLRARIARKLLRLMGQETIPVVVGHGASLTPDETRGWHGKEGQGIDLSESVANDFSALDAPAFLAQSIDAAAAEGRPLTLLTIGALTNVAIALERFPASMHKTARIVAMASNFEGFGEEHACSEHNVACDSLAMERVLRSGIPLTLIGYNVTRQTRLDWEQVLVWKERARNQPLIEALSGMHRVWFDHIGRDHSAMHDALAVAVAFRPELVTLLPVTARLRKDSPLSGSIIYNAVPEENVTAETASIRIASAVDVEAFHALFLSRIEQIIAAG
jgi:inosine-uridine nucleoside N-ribohydrolase